MSLTWVLTLLPLALGAAGTKPSLQFISSEHEDLAQTSNAILYDIWAIPLNISDVVFRNARGLSLGLYGHMLSLADYFGVASLASSVCLAQTDPQTLFRKAFETMWQTQDAEYLTSIQMEIDSEKSAILNARLTGVEESDKLWKMSLTRYLRLLSSVELSLYNLDHFSSSNCANQTYVVGHRLAQQTARSARPFVSSYPAVAQQLLSQAYAMNAFADHFLTDMFSAGHLRTPRVPLVQACHSIVSSAATTLRMHNEESYNGVWVRNQRGDQWLAKGDGFLFDKSSSVHYGIAQQAVETSIHEVSTAFLDSMAQDSFDSLRLVPVLEATLVEATCPMYRFSQSQLESRSPTNQVSAITNVSSCPTVNRSCSADGCCAYRSFDSSRDCYGGDSAIGSALDMVLHPPSIVYDECQNSWISIDGSDVSQTHKSALTMNLMPWSMCVLLVSLLICP